jgi:dUTP pyrophosphatase
MATKLFVVKQNPDAVIPSRVSSGSVGYDLSSCSDITIPSRERRVVPTGLLVRVPDGYYGRVAPKSGLSVKKCIDIGAGVIDQDYDGLLGIVVINNSPAEIQIKKHDKIAQLVLEKCITPEVECVEKLPEYIPRGASSVSRGANGFGSMD